MEAKPSAATCISIIQGNTIYSMGNTFRKLNVNPDCISGVADVVRPRTEPGVSQEHPVGWKKSVTKLDRPRDFEIAFNEMWEAAQPRVTSIKHNEQIGRCVLGKWHRSMCTLQGTNDSSHERCSGIVTYE